jgi:molybdopterin synthase sulfur carrier subunit
MATVYVPTPLRRLTSGASKVDVQGETIGELVQALEAQYPGVSERLLDDSGNLKRFINIFVNDDQIDGLEAQVAENDKVSIVPAMAGGERRIR